MPPPPPLKPVKRDNPLGDSKTALNAAINAGGFKLKPVDHSIDHGKYDSLFMIHKADTIEN